MVQDGNDLHRPRLIIRAVPQVAWEDLQTHSTGIALANRARIRKDGKTAGNHIKLVNELFGLLGCLLVVIDDDPIRIPSGIHEQTNLIRHRMRRRARTSRSFSSSVTRPLGFTSASARRWSMSAATSEGGHAIVQRIL